MVSLSRYVWHTTTGGREVLHHTVTKVTLPVDADEDALRDKLFLAGQEEDALRLALTSVGDKLSFVVNPTWECTLRCRHCSVLTQLRSRQAERLDIQKFTSFISRMLDHHPYRTLQLGFAGGEPLLRADDVAALLEAAASLLKDRAVVLASDLTTNGTVALGDDQVRALRLVDRFTVSVDGNHKEHNEQRKAYKAKFDPYATTLDNIRKMLDLGFHDKIHIQASLPDELLTKEYAAEVMRTFLRMGIERIHIGSIHPTNVYKKTTNNYLASLKSGIVRSKPCCKYRFGSVYSVDATGTVRDCNWEWAGNVLGTLDDRPETIYHRQTEMIAKEFPCFQDEKCMACPVIGYCWGGCVNGVTVIGNKPSRYCNQELLIENIERAAQEGKLVQ